MAHGEQNRPVVKLAPLFYDGVSEIKNSAGDVGSTSNELQKPSDCMKYFLKLKKLEICQNSKIVKTESFYKLGPKICTTPPPIFGRKNLSNPKLWHTVMVTSKLLMDTTNVIASDPQVWLLALIWCQIGIF